MTNYLIVPVVKAAGTGLTTAASNFAIRASTLETGIAINTSNSFIAVSEEMTMTINVHDLYSRYLIILLVHMSIDLLLFGYKVKTFLTN